jgi:hypothetical protein
VPDACRHIRVFLSSPGDVAEERLLARELLQGLQKAPFLRGRVTIDVVSWDEPEGAAPMLASLTPQESIDRGLPRPSECDITVCVLWGRMGTPLSNASKPDGAPYLSGTEWEFEDALRAGRQVLLYRRTAPVPVTLDDPALDDKRKQKKLVDAFFAQFTNPDGSLWGSYSTYNDPQEFANRLRGDIEHILSRVLTQRTGVNPGDTRPLVATEATTSYSRITNPGVQSRSAGTPLWLLGPLTVFAIELLGFSSSFVFNSTIGRTERFGWESPGEWFIWGLRSLVAPFIMVTLALAITTGTRWLGKTLEAHYSIARRIGHAAKQRCAATMTVLRLDDPLILGQAVAIASATALGLLLWVYSDLVHAVISPISETLPEHVERLGSQHGARRSEFLSLAVLLTMVLALCVRHLYRVRARHNLRGDTMWPRLAVAVFIAFIVVARAPYRVMFHNRFEKVDVAGDICYILGENRNELLVHCPAVSPPRNRIVERADPTVRRLGIRGSVYDSPDR